MREARDLVLSSKHCVRGPAAQAVALVIVNNAFVPDLFQFRMVQGMPLGEGCGPGRMPTSDLIILTDKLAVITPDRSSGILSRRVAHRSTTAFPDSGYTRTTQKQGKTPPRSCSFITVLRG